MKIYVKYITAEKVAELRKLYTAGTVVEELMTGKQIEL